MYKNYFYLHRLSGELDNLLRDSILSGAFSQEKNILVLEFRKAEEMFYLLMNVSQNDSYIQYRKEFHRAKKNATDIFDGYLPIEISGVSIAENDRIIRFSHAEKDLIFFFRGKDTNVLLTQSFNISDSFKKTPEEIVPKIEMELKHTNFIKDDYFPDFSGLSSGKDIYSEIKAKYPFIIKEIIAEAKARASDESAESIKNILYEIIRSIYYSDIAVQFDDSLQKMVFAPQDFLIFSGHEKKIFAQYSEAFNYFLISRFRKDREVNYKKLIAKNLNQQLSRLSSRISEIKIKLDEPPREEEYRNFGNLILANLYSISKGSDYAEIYDFNNEKIKIKLDEKLDAKKNADAYFRKAKNEKQSRIALSALFKKLEEQYRYLLTEKNKFEQAENNQDYLQIMSDLKIKDNRNTESGQDDSSEYRHFLIEQKYHLYVGKDSRNNDQLTTRFAKQNDYWFHARSVSGSHAVLRVDNTKELIPKSVLKKAASIAAFYSKAKTSKLAPVAYTLKKYVVKRKGMEPGAVSLLKENVLLVEPGIPDDCEYINE